MLAIAKAGLLACLLWVCVIYQETPSQFLSSRLPVRRDNPGSQNGNKQRILIVQFDERDPRSPVEDSVVPFWKHTAAINAQYARNHGYAYKFIVIRDVPEGRHSAWAHVATVRRLLASGRYDYILKLDSDAMLATTSPLNKIIDFTPLERGEKDIVVAIDAMYYDLYECPHVHNATVVARDCDAERGQELIRIQNAERCSAWFSVEAWKRGLHLGELRGLGNDELEERWLESWTSSGIFQPPPSTTVQVFNDYGLAQRRADLLHGNWWRGQNVSPALSAFGAFNSGVYLVKATATSLALFDDCWAAPVKACTGGSVNPRFATALRHLMTETAARGVCNTSATLNHSRSALQQPPKSAFSLRSTRAKPLSCVDNSLKDYLSGAGIDGSPLYEQPALSLILPQHMDRVEAYDGWDFNGPFSSFVWHPVGPAKQQPSIVQFFEKLLQQQFRAAGKTLATNSLQVSKLSTLEVAFSNFS